MSIQGMTFPEGDIRIPKGLQAPLTVSNSDVLAARMVGRWPNGISITETNTSSTSNINPHSKITFNSQCPFAAHIRKTGPRDDTSIRKDHHIMRRGIQFGDELRTDEKGNSDITQNKSDFVDSASYLDYSKEKNFRGLLFACYQSNIDNGFFFMQTQWCNFDKFPGPDFSKFKGIDPLIGQVDPLAGRSATGGKCTIAGMKDPAAKPDDLANMPFVNETVLPAGGEYFFMPSLKALKEVLSKA